MRKFALAALTLVAAPALARDPAPAAGDPSALASEILGDVRLDAKLTLLDAGAEPRRVVAYTPRAGASVAYENATKTTMDLSITMPGGEVMAMPLGDSIPAIVASARNTVGAPLPNGMIPVRVEMTGFRVEGSADAAAKEMAAAMAAMKGMAFDVLVDAAGRPTQMDVVAPAGDPAMASALQQMSDQLASQLQHFPDEAVGVGARWTVDVDMGLAGMDFVMHQTCTVVELAADRVGLKTELLLDMAAGKIAFPGIPPGMEPEITRFAGNGSGTLTTDLTTLVSLGKMSVSMDLAMNVASPDAGGKMSMSMKMKQDSELRPAR